MREKGKAKAKDTTPRLLAARAWLQINELVDLWAPEIGEPGDHLLSSLGTAILNGEFDHVAIDEKKSIRGWAIEDVNGRISPADSSHLRSESDPIGALGLLFRVGGVHLTREAAQLFAIRRSITPPSFWKKTARTGSRRGRPVGVAARVEQEMRVWLADGKTLEMTEEALAAQFGAARDTCRKIRNKLLAELSTIDK